MTTKRLCTTAIDFHAVPDATQVAQRVALSASFLTVSAVFSTVVLASNLREPEPPQHSHQKPERTKAHPAFLSSFSPWLTAFFASLVASLVICSLINFPPHHHRKRKKRTSLAFSTIGAAASTAWFVTCSVVSIPERRESEATRLTLGPLLLASDWGEGEGKLPSRRRP